MSSVFEEDLSFRPGYSLPPGLHEESNIQPDSQHNEDIEKWQSKYHQKESELKLSEDRLTHLTNFIAEHQRQLPDKNTLSQRFAKLKKGVNKSDSSDSGIGGQSLVSPLSATGSDHTNSFFGMSNTYGENLSNEDVQPVDILQVGASMQYFDNVMSELFKTKLHLTKLLNKDGADVHILKESIQLKEMVKDLQHEVEILKAQRDLLKRLLFAQVDSDISKYRKEAIYLVQKVDQLMRDVMTKDKLIENTNNSNEKLIMAMKELKKRNQKLLCPTDPETDPHEPTHVDLLELQMREMSCQTDEGKTTAKEIELQQQVTNLRRTLDETLQECKAMKVQCVASDEEYAQLLQNMENNKHEDVKQLERKLREGYGKNVRLEENYDRKIKELEESKKQQHSDDKCKIDLLEIEVKQMQTMKEKLEMLLEIQEKQEVVHTPVKHLIEHHLEPYSESLPTLCNPSMVQVDGSMSLKQTFKPTTKAKISPSESGAIPKVYTCERCQQVFTERQRFQDHREKCED